MTKKELRRIKRLAKGKPLSFEKRRKIVDSIQAALWRGTPPDERAAIAQHVIQHGTAMYATATGMDGKMVTLFDTHPLMQLIEKIDAMAQANAGDWATVVDGIMAKLEAPAN